MREKNIPSVVAAANVEEWRWEKFALRE